MADSEFERDPTGALTRWIALAERAMRPGGGAALAAMSDLLAELKAAYQTSSQDGAARSAGATRVASVGDPPPPSPDAMEAAMAVFDLSGYIARWTDAAQALFGYTADEVVGQHLLMLYSDDDDDLVDFSAPESHATTEMRAKRSNGEIFRIGLQMRLVRNAAGDPESIDAVFIELPDPLTNEEKLMLHARIIEDSDQGVLITDAHERIVSVNSAFTRITGYSPGEALGRTPDLLRSGRHDAEFRNKVRSAMQGGTPWSGEIFGRRKNGDVYPQMVSISTVRDERGQVTHAFSIFSDISAYRENEARLQRLANFDSITNLPNASLFNQLVSQALVEAQRTRDQGAVLVLRLRRLAAVTEGLGLSVGDELIREVCHSLRRALRDDDVLSRFATDTLAIGLLNIQKVEHAGIVAQKLLAALDLPFAVAGHEIKLEGAIGIATFPSDGMDLPALLRAAETALMRVNERSTQTDSAYLFYSAEMNQRASDHFKLESDLRRGIAGGELLLHYQPKVSLRSGRIVGAEALLRWRHRELGMVSPGTFVPIAEETGLILVLGDWVIDEACRQIRAWTDAGVQVVPVAINISARQFDALLPSRIQAALDRHRVGAEMLRVELTESLVVRGADLVVPIMNELAAMGLLIALDDFGTGYSSLAYLKKFPLHTLKIDRSFVIGIPAEENDCAIARAIVTMGKQLRQEIVAEGVETAEQMQFLRTLGCDQLQGYLFSPPLEADKFAAMLREGSRLSLSPL